jgi:hypothetical protein
VFVSLCCRPVRVGQCAPAASTSLNRQHKPTCVQDTHAHTQRHQRRRRAPVAEGVQLQVPQHHGRAQQHRGGVGDAQPGNALGHVARPLRECVCVCVCACVCVCVCALGCMRSVRFVARAVAGRGGGGGCRRQDRAVAACWAAAACTHHTPTSAAHLLKHSHVLANVAARHDAAAATQACGCRGGGRMTGRRQGREAYVCVPWPAQAEACSAAAACTRHATAPQRRAHRPRCWPRGCRTGWA